MPGGVEFGVFGGFVMGSVGTFKGFWFVGFGRGRWVRSVFLVWVRILGVLHGVCGCPFGISDTTGSRGRSGLVGGGR